MSSSLCLPTPVFCPNQPFSPKSPHCLDPQSGLATFTPLTQSVSLLPCSRSLRLERSCTAYSFENTQLLSGLDSAFRLKSTHSETDSEFHQLAHFPTISLWVQNGSPFSFLQGNDSNACSVPSASFLLVPCTSPIEPSHTHSRPQTKTNTSTVLFDTEDLPDSRMSFWSAL